MSFSNQNTPSVLKYIYIYRTEGVFILGGQSIRHVNVDFLSITKNGSNCFGMVHHDLKY
jgi:hypothetical protein